MPVTCFVDKAPNGAPCITLKDEKEEFKLGDSYRAVEHAEVDFSAFADFCRRNGVAITFEGEKL